MHLFWALPNSLSLKRSADSGDEIGQKNERASKEPPVIESVNSTVESDLFTAITVLPLENFLLLYIQIGLLLWTMVIDWRPVKSLESQL